MNPARTKIYSKPVDGYPIRQINSDYFGLLTDRWHDVQKSILN